LSAHNREITGLGLESSCDETSVSVVIDGRAILSNLVFSQIDLHKDFFGVVPEIASRAHLEAINGLVDGALKEAGKRFGDLDYVAATQRPGLVGSLLVALQSAKAISYAMNIPLIAVNHLQAHVYACRLAAEKDVFPCVGLIVSGGHSSLYRCRDPLDFEFLGGTIDDAAGEAFDKVAAMLGLPYPGGPSIERAAQHGDPKAYHFPRAFLADETRLDFSFSGLKTAVRYAIAGPGCPDPTQVRLDARQTADLAASFQEAAVDCLVGKAVAALKQTGLRVLCVGGGVAANARLRGRLREASERLGFDLHVAPLQLCTDNAVMGAIAVERWKAGLIESLDLDVLPGVVRKPAAS